jgi:ABC-2 type transport system permease protein
MLRLIASRELTEYVRDGRLLWIGGLIGVLLVTALAVGWQQRSSVESERVAAQALDYDDWLAQTQRHPHDAAHQGMHVFKPQPPLSIIDPGIVPYVGSTIWLQAHRQSEMKFRPAQDATGLQRFGSLSVAWVLQVLAPLLIIVMGFNAFAGEREQGTLRQTLSLGIPPARLLWGKAIALGTALALLLVPILLIAVFMALSLPATERTDSLTRLFWLAVGYSLYFTAMIFMVLGVSAVSRSSRVSLVVLLGLWIIGVILAPRVGSDVVRLAHPSPTRLEFNTGLDSALNSAYQEAWQQTFGIKTRWSGELSLGKWGAALKIDDHAGYGVIDKHFTALWDSFKDQQRNQEWLGLAFPLLAMRSFSMGIAGTDFEQHRHFSTAAERQRRVMQELMSDDLVRHADALGDRHFSYEAGPQLWKRVPRFEYHPPRAATALRQNWLSLGILAFGVVVALVFAHFVLRRRLLWQ